MVEGVRGQVWKMGEAGLSSGSPPQGNLPWLCWAMTILQDVSRS